MEMKLKRFKTGYTTGVFDLFHIGHLNILKKAKEECEFLIVGVSTDELVESYKNKTPVIPFEERIKIVEAIKYVDYVVPQISRNKLLALEKYEFDVMFVGDDWKGNSEWSSFEQEFRNKNVEIVYFPYTQGTSSTKLTETLNNFNNKFANL